MVQSLSVHPTEWLELTALQSVMFGGRLSLAYFLPVVPSQYVQTYLGDYDNALIGAAARVRLPFGAHAGAVLYVDDLNFRKIRNFDFDSGQNKLALDLQAGIAPPLPILTVLDARYRMVTPYMYAHHPAALDYLQYTHKGRHLGTLLPPNSDEITVRTRVFPAPWLAFDLSVRSVRHGGGCGGVPDSSCTIWHHGRVDEGFLFYGPSEFLTQAVLEGILQARAGIDVHVDLEPVELNVAPYRFQRGLLWWRMARQCNVSVEAARRVRIACPHALLWRRFRPIRARRGRMRLGGRAHAPPRRRPHLPRNQFTYM